jgi:hypothetical protein
LGLAVWPSNLDVAATNAKVLATYRAHQLAAMTEYLLIEGFAAIALAVVVLALGQAARRRGAERLGVATVVAGLIAAALSLAQCVLGLLLAGSVAPDGKTDQAGRLFDLINRMDGVKMFALAAMAVAGVWLVRRALLPRWLGYTAALLMVALIASGAGYLLLNSTLAQAAFVSGPLLLVWVTGAGVASPGQTGGARRRHDHGPDRPKRAGIGRFFRRLPHTPLGGAGRRVAFDDRLKRATGYGSGVGALGEERVPVERSPADEAHQLDLVPGQVR